MSDQARAAADTEAQGLLGLSDSRRRASWVDPQDGRQVETLLPLFLVLLAQAVFQQHRLRRRLGFFDLLEPVDQARVHRRREEESIIERAGVILNSRVDQIHSAGVVGEAAHAIKARTSPSRSV